MSTPSVSEIAATLRVQYGINSVRQMEQITTELLVNMPTAGAIGELSGDGDPTGLVVPQFDGQLFHDTTNDTYYRSTGTDASDWVAIGGSSSVQDIQIDWLPVNLQFGEKIGFFTYDTIAGLTSLTFRQSEFQEGFDIEFCADLLDISFPNLTEFLNGFATFYIYGCDALQSVSFPELLEIQRTIQIENCSTLSSVTFPLLQECLGIRIRNCPSLVNLQFPSLTLLTNGVTVDLSGDGLSAASVNGVLATAVASAGYVSGTINTSGGTSSAPTGQGIADKATLIGRGVTVTTN